MKRYIIYLMLACSATLFMGCGKNLFGVDASNKSVNELLNQASTPQEFEQAETKATEVIDSSTKTPEEKDKARIQRGQARLGKLGIDAIGVLKDIQVLAEKKESNSSGNVFEEITIVDTASSNVLAKAADDLNAVSTQNVTLTKDEENVKAIANAMIAVKLVKASYVVQSNGQVTPKGNVSEEAALEALMTPPTNSGKKSTDYMLIGAESYEKGATLKADQKKRN